MLRIKFEIVWEFKCQESVLVFSHEKNPREMIRIIQIYFKAISLWLFKTCYSLFFGFI